MTPLPTKPPLLARLFGKRTAYSDSLMTIHLVEWRGKFYPVGTTVKPAVETKTYPAKGWAAEHYFKP